MASDFSSLRIGQGADVHAFSTTKTGTLSLACLQWPNQRVLEGHSDGDVAAHSIADALLSASGLGDLGSVFGTDDPRWEGASGAAILQETVRLLSAEGWQIINVSVQIIGNEPRFSPRRDEATKALSCALGGAAVTVGATTTDRLGFLGRGEGLAALCSALISREAPRPL